MGVKRNCLVIKKKSLLKRLKIFKNNVREDELLARIINNGFYAQLTLQFVHKDLLL